jgi:hypothetical protein
MERPGAGMNWCGSDTAVMLTCLSLSSISLFPTAQKASSYNQQNIMGRMAMLRN